MNFTVWSLFITMAAAEGCVAAKPTDTGADTSPGDTEGEGETGADTGTAPDPTITVWLYADVSALFAECLDDGRINYSSGGLPTGSTHVFGAYPGDWIVTAVSYEAPTCCRSPVLHLEPGDEAVLTVDSFPGTWDEAKLSCL